MLTSYHRTITTQALQDLFNPLALEVILQVNLGQDNLFGQICHDEFHFDNNAFTKSLAYIDAQRTSFRPTLENDCPHTAWQAFGRLTHSVQDFYSHTNYVILWLACHVNPTVAPNMIDPLDPELLPSSDLRSGKLYYPGGELRDYPLEALSFIPGIKRLVIPQLPRDSHAWMNPDSPECGPNFVYAFTAAMKRTRHEFEITIRDLSVECLTRFSELKK